ncbi:hypothetical protein CQW23_18876 [Capsicum baccatum]|uniref:Plastid-lipid-associated protein 8, chloroplastic n=1 Tax=Capsicum baccatum TaxID=33114 RepID=A0A2G2W465_CAPBA|nr:hypothetical protein CQW23_18876 [Capsicum baccatum]
MATYVVAGAGIGATAFIGNPRRISAVSVQSSSQLALKFRRRTSKTFSPIYASVSASTAPVTKPNDLVATILSKVMQSDRGVLLAKDEHKSVAEVAQELQRFCVAEPVKCPLIFGEWDVVYCSNPTSPGGGYRSAFGRLFFKTNEMVQVVEAPDVVKNRVSFSLFGFLDGEVSLKGQLARTSTNSTGYLPPPTNNRYKGTLSTKARTYKKKSPNVCLCWELNLELSDAGKLNVLDEKWIQVVFEPPELKVGGLDFQYGGLQTQRGYLQCFENMVNFHDQTTPYSLLEIANDERYSPASVLTLKVHPPVIDAFLLHKGSPDMSLHLDKWSTKDKIDVLDFNKSPRFSQRFGFVQGLPGNFIKRPYDGTLKELAQLWNSCTHLSSSSTISIPPHPERPLTTNRYANWWYIGRTNLVGQNKIMLKVPLRPSEQGKSSTSSLVTSKTSPLSSKFSPSRGKLVKTGKGSGRPSLK